MHILGQILAGLCIIGAFTAAYLTTQVLQVRNEWMKRVETKKVAYEKLVPELPKLRQQLTDLQREYHRVNYDWGPVWSNLQAGPGAGGPGSIALAGIDATSGIKQEQIINLFQPDGKGGTSFVGPFKVTVLADGRTGLQANWLVRATEPATWQFGQGWRARIQVPASDSQNFIRYQNELLLRDIDLQHATRNRDLALNVDRKYAQDHLEFRISELHGDLALADKKGELPNYLVDGLVKAIEDQEEARNAEILQVDDLRHELKKVYDEVKALQLRNEALMKSLPGGNLPASKEPDPAIGAE